MILVSYQIAQRNLVLNFLYKKVHVRIGSKLIGGCELLLENLPRADRKQTSSTADSFFFFFYLCSCPLCSPDTDVATHRGQARAC